MTDTPLMALGLVDLLYALAYALAVVLLGWAVCALLLSAGRRRRGPGPPDPSALPPNRVPTGPHNYVWPDDVTPGEKVILPPGVHPGRVAAPPVPIRSRTPRPAAARKRKKRPDAAKK